MHMILRHRGNVCACTARNASALPSRLHLCSPNLRSVHSDPRPDYPTFLLLRSNHSGGIAVAAARTGAGDAAAQPKHGGDAAPSPQALLDVAKLAAAAGAKVVTDALGKPRNVKLKGAFDLVTKTDEASEKAILEVLRSHYPSHAILGEEGGVSGDTSTGLLWCVDPLDGTTNFVHQYPAFAVSVGVMQGPVPVAGCVVEFAGGPGTWVTRTYAACLGGGAACNGRPLRSSDVNSINEALLVTGFGYDHGPAWAQNNEFFKQLTDVSQGVRRLGAASVDLCHVAEGIVEAYWEYQLKPWDVCAGVIILTEAGGKVTTMDGKQYSPFHRSLLATNGPIHDALVDVMKGPTEKLVMENDVQLSPAFIPAGYEAGFAAEDAAAASTLRATRLGLQRKT